MVGERASAIDLCVAAFCLSLHRHSREALFNSRRLVKRESSTLALGFRPDVLASLLACSGLPSRCRGPGHFLLLAQEKVTKENGTPRGAVWAAPSQSVRGGRAFRPGSCPDEKCPTSCRAPLRGLIVHPSPPHRGCLKARAAERHIAMQRWWRHRSLWERTLCATAEVMPPRHGRSLGALLQVGQQARLPRAPAPHPSPLSHRDYLRVARGGEGAKRAPL